MTCHRHWVGKRVVVSALGLVALTLAWPTICRINHAATPPAESALAVTNGLIRWWPNLFDARDEITGQEGIVVGVLPAVRTGEEDPTELGRNTGWVLLQPAITNEVFTLSFWVRCSTNRPLIYARLFGQESNVEEWVFQTDRGGLEFVLGRYTADEADWTEPVVLTAETWQHVAIARRADGTSMIWLDGRLKVDGRVPHAWPANARWLSVGNSIKGGEGEFHGGIRDLAVFGRVLSEIEVGAMHAAGLPRRPAQNTSPRLAATALPVPVKVSTNVTDEVASAWTHRRYTTEDGLPGNVVKAVLQARSGHLWVGTEDGLARFDGRQFRTLSADNTPALASIGHTVWSLAEDTDGTVWAGIFGGLARVRGLECVAFTNGLPQRFLLQVEPAGDGTLWIAGFKTTIPRGPCWLRRYNPETGRSDCEVIVPGHVRRMVAVSNGVWLATEQSQQMLFWDGRAAAPQVVGIVHDQPNRISLAQSGVLPMEAEVQVWADAARPSHGWAQVRPGGNGPAFGWLWDLEYSLRPWIGRWYGPSATETWLAVGRELARLHEGKLERIRLGDGLAGLEITCVCSDREGGVWFGTDQDGLHFVQEKPVRVFTTRDHLADNDVRSLSATPSGGLWVATVRGLSHWKGNLMSTLPKEQRARSIAVDQSGDPWFGLAQFGQWALLRHRAGDAEGIFLGLEWQDPSNLRFAEDGTLWVACERGLTWIKPERLVRHSAGYWSPPKADTNAAYGRFVAGQELPRLYPLGLIEDSDGSIWMGSLGHGLFHVRGTVVENFNQKDGLPGHHCVPAHLDASGGLWILSPGAITRRRENRFESITVKHGLPKDIFLDMVEDSEGTFWVSGKRGIHRLVRQDLEGVFRGSSSSVASLTLGVQDGLLTPECSSLHYPSIATTLDGRVWVATRKGLASFHPSRVRRDTKALPVAIERLVANGRETTDLMRMHSGKAPLALPPGSGRQLVFHYSAISLTAADRVRFRYHLDGYDSDWAPETDLRLAFYTNLRPGAYQFRVKAANAHGVWGDDEAVLALTIAPYLWQTKSFYLVLGVALLSLAALIHSRRLAGQRRYQQLRHEQNLMAEKARIAADMHDELGATLTQITILSEIGKSQLADPNRIRSTLDRVARAARDVTSRMSDLVWATNPRNDTLDNLSAYLREHAASQLEGTTVQPNLLFPETVPQRHVSALLRRNLLLVLKESIQNMLKHSDASEAVIALSVHDEFLTLRVHDNGRGFDPGESHPRGNGLGNMRRRMEDLGGSLSMVSAPGKGTDIVARVPWSSPS